MARLDHLTIVAPTLAEGVEHVRTSLGVEVPFGTRHPYMGTHNHRLQLGPAVYLEIVALDPEARPPGRPRWFGLDDQGKVSRLGCRPPPVRLGGQHRGNRCRGQAVATGIRIRHGG